MTTARRGLVIGWKVSTLAPQTASVRYRALLPILALEQDGVQCRVFSDPYCVDLEALDALVIVKGLSLKDHKLAHMAFAKRVPIILDLCDNIFVNSYGQAGAEFSPMPADAFAAVAQLASAIVVSTESLADVVRAHCGREHGIFVIPDGVETPTQFREVSARLKAAQGVQNRQILRIAGQRLLHSLARLHDFGWLASAPIAKRWTRFAELLMAKRNWYALLRNRTGRATRKADRPREEGADSSPAQRVPGSPTRQILWFGIHGAEHANFGMLDLLLIRADLEQIAGEFDVELVVVSNNHQKFQSQIAPFKIRSRYLDWTASVVEQQLQSAALVVIPNSLDSFSLCKSANRAVLALNAGVPVVATLAPALRGLSGCIQSGSFLHGMRRYLSDADQAAHDVSQGQALIRQMFGSKQVASMWLDVLQTVVRKREASAVPAEGPPDAELVVAIHLIMDIDLALPVIHKAQDMGIAVLVLCNAEIRATRPDIDALLREHCDRYLFVHGMMLDRNFLFPASAKALLTFSETNLRPHAFNRQLTKMANRAGLATYTTQHGFENVGLTYDDTIQPIRKISFLSRHIFIWGELETLHPSAPLSNRRKCIPVGCPKPAQGSKTMLPEIFSSGQAMVGVFENLHWKRYSDAYRQAFLSNVLQVAGQYPEILFLMKPHNAGLWLTKRFRGTLPSLPNIVIADPKSPDWKSSTASSLFWRCAAVVTTPSTVALDAARHGLPVAVVAQEFALDNYAPLPLLREPKDWQRFVANAVEPQQRQRLLDLAQGFCRRVVLPNGAETRMLEAMLPQHARATRPHAGAGYAIVR
jgi:hypothetical protein